MRHAYLVAVAAINPAWLPETMTLKEQLTVQWDRLWLRPYWRTATRWIRRAMICVCLVF